VAADPDSLSGKARKASAYGIPIVAESAFDALLAEPF
jgi:DNA polymerase-3 subunit epsilon